MVDEIKPKRTKEHKQKIIIFFVWLNEVKKLMPQQVRKLTLKDMHKCIETQANLMPISVLNKLEFDKYVNEFIQYTYTHWLGYYYDIDNLINLVEKFKSDFKSLHHSPE